MNNMGLGTKRSDEFSHHLVNEKAAVLWIIKQCQFLVAILWLKERKM
ncbi:MAG: hypothetical protein ACE5HR_03615 [bacterium]